VSTTETEALTGPVLAAKAWPTNGDLIADVARLGYLRDGDRILDPTWGLGRFWTRWKPRELFGSDLDPAKSPSAPADFRHLDEWVSGYFDAVTLDGPYKLNGTATKAVDGRYGVDTYAGPSERHGLICDGMTECTRVLRVGGVLLVKCQDQVCSGRIWWQTDIFTRHGESLGLVKVDRFDMLGTGRPQPERTRADGKPSVQQHAYGRSSTLLVFRKGAPAPEAML
jgi:hypothetical protein